MTAKLTILTDPVPCGRFLLSEHIKRIARPVKQHIRPVPAHLRSVYRGHPAVTRSLVEGLQRLGVSHTYNPKSLSEVAECVIVLSSVRALWQAVMWKRQGRITRLIAGPNIVIFPSDCSEISAPEVDLCITPSDWTCKLYVEDCPELQGRCVAWPAGVDTNYWKLNGGGCDTKNVLLYEKQAAGPVPLISDYAEILMRRGYRVHLIKFGAYKPDEFRQALQRSNLMVGFSRSESQGIAWAEAWSMDVPTLLWQCDTNTIRERTVHTSPAPYLTAENGSFFDSLESFELLLTEWEKGHLKYHPRRWALENMSDEVCARQICVLTGVVSELESYNVSPIGFHG